MEEKLHYLAYYDHLTHLPNRTFLENMGQRLIREVEKEKENWHLSI